MDIPELESDHLIVDSCRRLTGPSLVWDEPGAILDLLVFEMNASQVLDCWYRQLEILLNEVDWISPRLTHRAFENGYNLLLAAPVDQLYSAVLALETSWYFTAAELLDKSVECREILIDDLRKHMLGEMNPALIELESAAADHGVDFLVDDDDVSIGHGIGSQRFPIDQIPSPGQIDWPKIHDIPVALITGTNGKSTSVRLLDGIATAAGQVSGVTSTDFIRVGKDVLDQGDCSGPGSARLLLRDTRLEVAFLEVARGGILRRGLPLRRARVALVTNIASDHLGQYGVNTLAALTQTKFAVRRTLADDGILVSNADDPEIVRYLATQSARNIIWFSQDKSNPQIQRQISLKQPCSFADSGLLVHFNGHKLIEVCSINDVPMTMDGAALHNISNALGAIGVAMSMGYAPSQISAGLMGFHSDESDNPGRMNMFRLSSSARVIVDFAHNAHGVAAMIDTLKRMPAKQKWAMLGSPGDRSDKDIEAIAVEVCAAKPEHIVITEVGSYLRGRQPGEVSHILKQACLRSGMSESSIQLSDSPLDGTRLVLAQMQADDLALLLVLSDRDQVIEYLKSH